MNTDSSFLSQLVLFEMPRVCHFTVRVVELVGLAGRRTAILGAIRLRQLSRVGSSQDPFAQRHINQISLPHDFFKNKLLSNLMETQFSTATFGQVFCEGCEADP